MKSFIGEGTGVEPVDNRQLPSRLWAPGSGQASRKILGFALIPNCELKSGPVHNAPGTWLHRGVATGPPGPGPPAGAAHHPHKDGAEWGAAGHAGLPRGPGDPEAAESETSVLGKYPSLSAKPTPFSHC